MKYTFTLFIVLAATFSLVAQDSSNHGRKKKPKRLYLSNFADDHRKRTQDSEYEKLDSTINRIVVNGQLENFYKEEFEYDTDGNLIRNTDYSWDSQNQTWVNDSRWDFTYNAEGRVNTVTGYIWTNGVWTLDNREVISYDSMGRVSQYLGQRWDASTEEWINDYRELRGYLSQDQVRTSSDFIWDGSEWILIRVVNYNYDQEERLIEEIIYTGTSGDSQSERILYTYNLNGDRTEKLVQTWDGAWVNQTQSLYSYNNENQLREEVIRQYQGGAWVNLTRFVYTYSFSVDESNLKLPEFFYVSDGQIDVNALANNDEYSWNASSNTWEKVAERQLAFSPFEGPVTGYTALTSEKVSIYPNPTSDGIWIDAPSTGKALLIEIYSLQGRLLSSMEAERQTFLPMNMLDKGTYLLKIHSDKTISTEKIIYR